MLRPSRLLWVGVALTGVAFSVRAQAGSFPNPIDSDGCGTIFIAGDMSNPAGGIFNQAATVKECQKLCKHAASACRTWTKRNASCVSDYFQDLGDYVSAYCKVLHPEGGSDLKECKQASKESTSADKAGVKEDLENALGDCLEWGETCASTCLAPPA